MTRKEEIREAALITKEKLVDAPDSLKIAKAAINELVDTILELTAPESSPAPLSESQDELWKNFYEDFVGEKRLFDFQLRNKWILTRRTEGDLEK